MGRPRKIDPADGQPCLSKRDCVLTAGQQVFLECGYAAASMDAVAVRANVSKATIYAYFDNKRALFEAVIGGRCVAALSEFTVPQQHGDARAVLTDLALQVLKRQLAPEALALHRVVLGEAPRQPELGEAFYAAGPALGIELVGRLFADLTRRGLLAIPEGKLPLVVDLFLAMLKGDVHTRALLGLPNGTHCLECIADMAADLVVARYGVVK